MPVPDGESPLEAEEEPAAPVAQDPSDDNFAPLDPEPVTATSPGPPSSDAPASDQVPLPAADGFDERVYQDFLGLLYLGALTREFSWVGHRFKIKTLNVDEVLEIGLLSQPYVGSIGETKAYQAAVVAGCIMEVDGQAVALPLTNLPSDTLLAAKFTYIKRHWFPPTLDVIYDRYLGLERRVLEVLDVMGESFGQE